MFAKEYSSNLRLYPRCQELETMLHIIRVKRQYLGSTCLVALNVHFH